MKPIIPIMTVLLAALLAIFPADLAAQGNKIQVKGNVADVDSKPIPGATIMVKGNPSLGGAVSDEQGNFTFSFPLPIQAPMSRRRLLSRRSRQRIRHRKNMTVHDPPY
mgnify:CR=1 FL=1